MARSVKMICGSAWDKLTDMLSRTKVDERVVKVTCPKCKAEFDYSVKVEATGSVLDFKSGLSALCPWK